MKYDTIKADRKQGTTSFAQLYAQHTMCILHTHIVLINGVLRTVVVGHPFDNTDEIADETWNHAFQNAGIAAQYEFVDYSGLVKLFDHCKHVFFFFCFSIAFVKNFIICVQSLSTFRV